MCSRVMTEFKSVPAVADSPEWTKVFSAVIDLHQTLKRHSVLDTVPDAGKNLIALHAELAALQGDKVVEAYWRAQLTYYAGEEQKATKAPSTDMDCSLAG